MRYILDTEQRRDNCLDKIKQTPYGQGWAVEIRPYEELRTHAQNRTMHNWLKIIDDFRGEAPDTAKTRIKISMGLYDEYVVDDKVIIKPKTSARFTKKQMIDFMQAIEIMALEYNLKLPYPDDWREIND